MGEYVWGKVKVGMSAQATAIILESNGRFSLSPTLVVTGTIRMAQIPLTRNFQVSRWVNTSEDQLWGYREGIGVKSTNVNFYQGTHAHSDHIGAADVVIECFKLQRVYTPEYSDAWITDPARLRDNQYVYDQVIAVADRAGTEYGAPLIQHLDPAAPVAPDESASPTASPEFDFGDMHIEIVNYDEDYKAPPYVSDANLMAWGAKSPPTGEVHSWRPIVKTLTATRIASPDDHW